MLMNPIVDAMKKMYCPTSKYIYSFFVCVVIFASFANGAPQINRRHGYQSWTSPDDETELKMEWVNPCGGEPLCPTPVTKFDNETGPRLRNRVLKTFRESVQNFILRLSEPSVNVIDTSDISDWFKYNSTYAFLNRIDATKAPVNLPKRHRELQKYVAAFQLLAKKQKRFDSLQNEKNAKTKEIGLMLTVSRNLLCEIETAINTTKLAMPVVLTGERMHQLLKFRNNNSFGRYGKEEIDELDNKFAKVRFHEYLQNLLRTLRRSGRRLGPRKRGLKSSGANRVTKVKKGTKTMKGEGSKGTKSMKGEGSKKTNKRKNKISKRIECPVPQ